jgi:predicted nucleic acid-binding protein
MKWKKSGESVMALLIDTSLWVDYTRWKSPPSLKQFIAPYILNPDAYLAEPIIFEVLRGAREDEKPILKKAFNLLPTLSTPATLWERAVELTEKCRTAKFTAGVMDVIIAAVALEHAAEVVTFDGDFRSIAAISGLRVHLLKRP